MIMKMTQVILNIISDDYLSMRNVVDDPYHSNNIRPIHDNSS